jgi:SAM-dependent MidA family methyltransferase
MSLPVPDADAIAHSARLQALIRREIADTGWMPFSRYMMRALYAPGLGYYSGVLQKFGRGGDFVTAPELSPLFGCCLARQLSELMALSAPHLLETGAGSGRLAADLLSALDDLGCAPESYRILELSADLRARQRALIEREVPGLAGRVEWLDTLPERFSGVVFGNELLDALPVERIRLAGAAVEEAGLTLDGDGRIILSWRTAPPALADAAVALGLPHGYETELGLAGRAWVAEWARRIDLGALLLIDYGFPQAEYYHPDRSTGTLMCHYRHHAHAEPLWMPGLCDITAHVDFTAVAQAAFDAGLQLAGYTSQATFLLNCGLPGLLADPPGDTGDALARARRNAEVNRLTSPAEMGELFKVICMTRGIDAPLSGFARGDRSHAL